MDNVYVRGISAAILFWVFIANSQAAAEEERLEEIEEAIERIEGRIGSRSVVQGFDALEVTLGGLMHFAYTHVSRQNESI